MELHLFRHGQTDWNEIRRVQGQSDSRLTPLGEEQARELGKRIGQIPFAAAYCSSSLRARQTADRALGGRGLEISYQDALREIYLGPWEGRLYDDVAREEPEAFHRFWHEPHRFQVEGAESFLDLQRRALDAVGKIRDTWQGKTVALVSHGAWIKSVLAHWQGRDLSELWQPPHMRNCSHSIVRFDGGGTCRVVRHADQPA